MSMEQTFAEVWKSKSNEELYRTLIDVQEASEVNPKSKNEFWKKYSAARLLAWRQYAPAAEVFLELLDNPKKGIGTHLSCVEYGTPVDPGSKFDFSDDAKPWEVQAMAVESLGMMYHKPARESLERVLKEINPNGYYYPSLGAACMYAIFRLNCPKSDNLQENRVFLGREDHDLLLFAAAECNKMFFTYTFFRDTLNLFIRHGSFLYKNGNREPLAERYIQALIKASKSFNEEELSSMTLKIFHKDIEEFEKECRMTFSRRKFVITI